MTPTTTFRPSEMFQFQAAMVLVIFALAIAIFAQYQQQQAYYYLPPQYGYNVGYQYQQLQQVVPQPQQVFQPFQTTPQLTPQPNPVQIMRSDAVQQSTTTFTTLTSVLTNNSPPDSVPSLTQPENSVLLHVLEPIVMESDPITMENHPDKHTTVVQTIVTDVFLTPIIVENAPKVPFSPQPIPSSQSAGIVDSSQPLPAQIEANKNDVLPVYAAADNVLVNLKHDANNIVASGINSQIVESNIMMVIHDGEEMGNSNSTDSAAQPSIEVYTQMIIADAGTVLSPIIDEKEKHDLSEAIKSIHADQLTLEKEIDKALTSGADLSSIEGLDSTPYISSILLRTKAEISDFMNNTQIVSQDEMKLTAEPRHRN